VPSLSALAPTSWAAIGMGESVPPPALAARPTSIAEPPVLAADPSIARSTRSLLSAGVAAGLLPFRPDDAARAGALVPGYAAAAAAGVVKLGSEALHAAKRLPESGRSAPRAPKAPVGPPGNASAGGVAGGTGGAASGVWCAILLGCMLYLAQELRRHRIGLSLPAPRGVVFLLHRPG
jgi:hypothetical protein